jgi:AraC family transcriptional regulator
MNEKRYPKAEAIEIESTSEVIEIMPAISSKGAAWSGLVLEKYRIPGQGCTAPEMFYSSHTIIIQGRGEARVSRRVNGAVQIEKFTRDDIGIFPRGVSFSAQTDSENDFIVLHLDPSLLSRAAGESFRSDLFEIEPKVGIEDRIINQIGDLLLMEAEAEWSAGSLYADSLANAMAVHLLRRYTTKPQQSVGWTGGLPKQKLKSVIEYIEENLQEDIRLGCLAAIAHMSQFHFARAFKLSTGLSPIQYLIGRRIELAKQLLKKRELTIAEIAYRVGFSSQSHFNKYFIKLAKTTPGSYRKSNSF